MNGRCGEAALRHAIYVERQLRAYSVEKLTCSPEQAAPPEYHPVKTRFNKQRFPVDLWEEQRSEFLR